MNRPDPTCPRRSGGYANAGAQAPVWDSITPRSGSVDTGGFVDQLILREPGQSLGES
jgi:hypothetical protein